MHIWNELNSETLIFENWNGAENGKNLQIFFSRFSRETKKHVAISSIASHFRHDLEKSKTVARNSEKKEKRSKKEALKFEIDLKAHKNLWSANDPCYFQLYAIAQTRFYK